MVGFEKRLFKATVAFFFFTFGMRWILGREGYARWNRFNRAVYDWSPVVFTVAVALALVVALATGWRP